MRHFYLFWVRLIQSMTFHSASWIPFLILFSRWCLVVQSGLIFSGFLTRIMYAFSFFPIHCTWAPPPTQFIHLKLVTIIRFSKDQKTWSHVIFCCLLHRRFTVPSSATLSSPQRFSCHYTVESYLLPFIAKYYPQDPIFGTFTPYYSIKASGQLSQTHKIGKTVVT